MYKKLEKKEKDTMNTLIVGSIITVAVMIAFLDYCCVASKRDRKQDDQEQLLWIEEHC